MGALDPAQAALAKARLAAMKRIAPPRRPETLHLALRYERLAREGRIVPRRHMIRVFTPASTLASRRRSR